MGHLPRAIWSISLKILIDNNNFICWPTRLEHDAHCESIVVGMNVLAMCVTSMHKKHCPVFTNICRTECDDGRNSPKNGTASEDERNSPKRTAFLGTIHARAHAHVGVRAHSKKYLVRPSTTNTAPFWQTFAERNLTVNGIPPKRAIFLGKILLDATKKRKRHPDRIRTNNLKAGSRALNLYPTSSDTETECRYPWYWIAARQQWRWTVWARVWESFFYTYFFTYIHEKGQSQSSFGRNIMNWWKICRLI